MSLEKLIELSRRKLTPEQESELRKRTIAMHAELDRQIIERFRCGECGVDTLNYSHSFKCSRRGLF